MYVLAYECFETFKEILDLGLGHLHYRRPNLLGGRTLLPGCPSSNQRWSLRIPCRFSRADVCVLLLLPATPFDLVLVRS